MSRTPNPPTAPTCIEICSGAGGQALGLEMAGFEALAHVENDRHACKPALKNIFPTKFSGTLILLWCSCFVGCDSRQGEAEALERNREAALREEAAKQNRMGYNYDLGIGVPQDDAEAVKWYRKAAEKGHAGSQYNLGLSYARGKGVPQDDEEAVKWYRKSAEQGNAGAQCALGLKYALGVGVPKDLVTGYMWLNIASSQSDTNAIEAKYGIAQLMTKDEIAEAQKLSGEWVKSKGSVLSH